MRTVLALALLWALGSSACLRHVAHAQAPDQAELEATAQRLFANDQLDAAGRLYEELAARSEVIAERARALTLAAWIAWLAADSPRAEMLLGRLVQEAPSFEPDPSRYDPVFLSLWRAARDGASRGSASLVAALVDEAAAFARGGDHRAAAQRLDQALAIDPRSPLVLLHRARAAARLGEHASSLELLDRLERIVTDPAHSGGRPSLADVLAERGLTHYRAGDFDSAAQALARAAELDPDQDSTWINLALAREQAGDLLGAESAYRQLVDLGRADIRTWRSLAAVVAKRGDWTAARELLESAVAQGPATTELPALLYEIARADRALGRLDDARARLERVVSLLVSQSATTEAEPTLAVVRRELAFVLLEAGDPAAALESADEATREDPEHADAHLARGRALLETGRAGEAVAALERALELRPARGDIANTLGRAHHLAGDAPAAAVAFAEALRLDPTLEAARENLA